MKSRTIIEKIWDTHVVAEEPGAPSAALHRSAPGARSHVAAGVPGLRERGLKVRRPDLTIATTDHSIPTTTASLPDPRSDRGQAGRAARNRTARNSASRCYRRAVDHQGIVHVIGPELGLTQPGMTVVCGDSHTATHGAFGALAFGIGTSEVENVLASPVPAAARRKPSSPRGWRAEARRFGQGHHSGADRADRHRRRHRLDFRIHGLGHSALSMEERMTVCNMSIEGGARAGLIAPDDTTYQYLHGPAVRSEGRGVGRGRRALAATADR